MGDVKVGCFSHPLRPPHSSRGISNYGANKREAPGPVIVQNLQGGGAEMIGPLHVSSESGSRFVLGLGLGLVPWGGAIDLGRIDR